MKKAIQRTTVVFIALTTGIFIFVLLLFAGNKTKGPLQDLFQSVDNNVSKLEKKMAGGNLREDRSTSLKWLAPYRNSKLSLNYTENILLGAYDNNTAESYEKLIELEDSLNTKLPIIHLYSAWGSKKEEVFPLLRAQAIYDLGSIPMITWEPWLNDFDPGQFPRLETADKINKNGMKAITAGVYDAYLKTWAKSARDFQAPLYVRLGHEMNDPYRYPWGPQNNKQEEFIAAWVHVVNLFRNAGANNVIWVWSPHPAYPGYEHYYPGGDYVDWIGIGILNYGTVAPWSQWWSFDETFKKCYDILSLFKKPMMISEFGTLEVGGDRAAWYKAALDSMPVKYPAVKSIIFFNNSNDNTTTYKVLDWSITGDTRVTEAVKKSVKGWDKMSLKK